MALTQGFRFTGFLREDSATVRYDLLVPGCFGLRGMMKLRLLPWKGLQVFRFAYFFAVDVVGFRAGSPVNDSSTHNSSPNSGALLRGS